MKKIIKIKTTKGPVNIEATIVGGLAIHKQYLGGNKYALTHVNTGRSIVPFGCYKRDKALEKAIKIDKLFPWDTIEKPEDIIKIEDSIKVKIKNILEER